MPRLANQSAKNTEKTPFFSPNFMILSVCGALGKTSLPVEFLFVLRAERQGDGVRGEAVSGKRGNGHHADPTACDENFRGRIEVISGDLTLADIARTHDPFAHDAVARAAGDGRGFDFVVSNHKNIGHAGGDQFAIRIEQQTLVVRKRPVQCRDVRPVVCGFQSAEQRPVRFRIDCQGVTVFDNLAGHRSAGLCKNENTGPIRRSGHTAVSGRYINPGKPAWHCSAQQIFHAVQCARVELESADRAGKREPVEMFAEKNRAAIVDHDAFKDRHPVAEPAIGKWHPGDRQEPVVVPLPADGGFLAH